MQRSEENMIFYFICYPKGDSRNKAIKAARYLSLYYDLEYDLFDSRYNEETNEGLGEFQ